MARHNELGKTGESAAVEFLQKNGHEILAQNYRFGKAEIDIISKEGDMLVFTEVKLRSTDNFGFPEEFVNKKKRKLIQSAAGEYLAENKYDGEIRFDILAISNLIDGLKIYHIKDAFFNEGGDEAYQ
jgi:putative endonuclease